MKRVGPAALLMAVIAGGVGTIGAEQQAGGPPRDTASSRVTLAVVGGFLIDGHGGLPKANAVILLEGSRIAAVGDEGRLAVPPGVPAVDANGLTVMPGLIDTHVHLDLIGHGNYPQWHALVRDNYSDVMRLSAAQLLAHGITSALDAAGDTRVSVETRDRIDRGELKGPRLLVSGGWIQQSPDEVWKRHYRASQISNAHTAEEARDATRSSSTPVSTQSRSTPGSRSIRSARSATKRIGAASSWALTSIRRRRCRTRSSGASISCIMQARAIRIRSTGPTRSE